MATGFSPPPSLPTSSDPSSLTLTTTSGSSGAQGGGALQPAMPALRAQRQSGPTMTSLQDVEGQDDDDASSVTTSVYDQLQAELDAARLRKEALDREAAEQAERIRRITERQEKAATRSKASR